MDLNWIIKTAKELLEDDGLAGLTHIGIAYEEDTWQLEIFNAEEPELIAFIIRNEKDLDNFWAVIEMGA